MVPVIDLFAGPGGLSEGFEQYKVRNTRVFRSVLSIEKERNAHTTLLLRAFFRQFKTTPKDYYEYIRGKLSLKDLYKKYPQQHANAKEQAIRLALATRNRKRIDKLIRRALRGHDGRWVLIGGPPCQAYSLAGRSRIKAEGHERFENDSRHVLYKEYLRIVRKFKPPVFLMENVKGLLSSSAKGVETFSKILEDFKDAGYSIHSFVKKGSGDQLKPTDYVIKAEKYGIPQARHRVILLGVKNGVDRGSSLLRPMKKVAIQSALSDLPRIRSCVSPLTRDSYEAWERELYLLRTVFTQDGKLRKMKGRRRALAYLPIGTAFIPATYPNPSCSKWLQTQERWFFDRRIKGITLHESRRHMPTDLRRYLFASHYAHINKVSPKIADFTSWQRPEHKNIKKAAKEVPFADRFRVQLRGRPATTVVSHICKDGHYYIHYDPTQCRSLTVREAARLQTFPDNYYFTGTRTAQYHQVGNAVPPLLANRMAKIVQRILARL